MFRVIIAGSRGFSDYELLKNRLDYLLQNKRDVTIISGTARGAAQLGEKYAAERGYEVERHPADWDKHVKSAGYRRNAEMAEHSDALVVFWDGQSRGTQHMINLATEKGLAIRVISTFSNQFKYQ